MATHRWPDSVPDVVCEPAEEERTCPRCGARMSICDHRFRRIERLSGPIRLVCKLLKCFAPTCTSPGKTFSPTAERLLAPPRATIDWELFTWIGYRRFERHWSVPQLRAELRDSYRVVLSDDTIEEYVHRYEVVVATRQGDLTRLKALYAGTDGLMLSIDGLQPEKGHETLYVVRELTLGRVLFAEPLLSSTATEVEALLVRARDLAAALGKPVLGWITDKQGAFVSGLAKVFPEVPHRYCKLHFVRALAAPVLADDSHVKVQMRKKVRGLRTIEQAVVRARTEADAAAAATAQAAVPVAPGAMPSTTARVAPQEVVLDYCAAVRGILSDDQGSATDPPGLRMAQALEDVDASLTRCLKGKKGGPRRSTSSRCARASSRA
jgi:hypothetical protein